MLMRITCLFLFSLSIYASDLSNIQDLLRTDEAKAEQTLLTAVKQADTQAQAALMLTQLYNGQAKLDEAIDYGKLAVKYAPQDGVAHFEYAKAIRNKMQKNRFFAMTNTGTYTEHLNKAIELSPDNPEPFLERIGFLLNAPSIAGGSESKAKEMVEKAKQKSDVWGLRAELMIANHEENDAEGLRLLKALTEADPENEIHFVRYGLRLSRDEKYAEAVQFFESSLAKKPQYFSLLYQLGRIRYIAKQDLEKAEANFTRYIDNLPPAFDRESYYIELDAAYWRRGLVRQALDQKDKAKADFEKALKLNPDNDDAKEALKKL
jgi:tetratricopeptide (TPR) repeat protein